MIFVKIGSQYINIDRVLSATVDGEYLHLHMTNRDNIALMGAEAQEMLRQLNFHCRNAPSGLNVAGEKPPSQP